MFIKITSKFPTYPSLQWNYYMTLLAILPAYVRMVTLTNLTRFRASGLRYIEKQKKLSRS